MYNGPFKIVILYPLIKAHLLENPEKLIAVNHQMGLSTWWSYISSWTDKFQGEELLLLIQLHKASSELYLIIPFLY